MKKDLVRFAVLIVSLCMTSMASTAQWEQVSGPCAYRINALVVSGNTILAGTDNGIMQSNKGGASWTNVGGGSVYSFAVSGSTIFAGTHRGVIISNNNGTSWTHAGLNSNLIYSLAIKGTNIFAGTDSGLFMANINGTNWIPDTVGIGNREIDCLGVGGSTIVAAGLASGFFISNNNGESWTEFPSHSFTESNVVNSILVGGNNMLFASQHGFTMYINGDTNWTAVGIPQVGDGGVGNPGGWGGCNTLLAACSSTIVAGTCGSGPYVSTDNGISWTADTTGIGKMVFTSLTASNNAIYAGTSTGVWRRPLPQATGVSNDNPFLRTSHDANIEIRFGGATNTAATIAFLTPLSGKVDIAAYDLAGRRTAPIVSKDFEQGTYCIPWDTRNISPGCYIVKMRAGSTINATRVAVSR